MNDSDEPAADRPWVVIADDDADIRHLVGLAAARAGLAIGAAVGDGEAALRAIRELTPELAILDVAMPGMTGLEVCRSVRSDPAIAATSLMLLTAAVQESAITAGMTAGADIYVHKPFSPRLLARQIESLVFGVETR